MGQNMTAGAAAPPPAAAAAPVLPPANTASRRSLSNKAVSNLLLALFGALFLLPMVWLVLASLDSNATWSVEIPHLTGANFAAALSGSDLQSIVNSIVLSGVSTAIATVCGALAAYA